MDKFEQKLRNYYQYHEDYQPEAISEAFLERLKALESSPEAAKRPRRRYVLPIAAAAALALAVGGWFFWQHAANPVPVQTPVAIQSGPSNDAAESPSEPSKPAAKPQAGTKAAQPQTQEEPVPEESVTLTKPEARPNTGNVSPAKSETATPAKAEETAPEKPEDTTSAHPEETTPAMPHDETPENPNSVTPGKPNSETPAKPIDETPTEPIVEPSANPDDGKPDDPPPAEPDDPTPADPVDPNPQTPEDPDPPEVTPPVDDPPYIRLSDIGTEYRKDGGWETLVLTLLSTGERVEIDVTGWRSEVSVIAASAASETHAAAYTKTCTAFGERITYRLYYDKDRNVCVELEFENADHNN